MMAEYIVEFDKTPYDHMVVEGIIKETDNLTLYGMPVNGEIIRCRDCKHFKLTFLRCKKSFTPRFSEDGNRIGFEESRIDPDGFCAWAERDA